LPLVFFILFLPLRAVLHLHFRLPVISDPFEMLSYFF